MLAIGGTLGRYELSHSIRDTQIGRAFVAVWRGTGGFEKPVVIRCADRDRLDEVLAEAKRAARLSHSGITHVLDAGAFEHLCYVVTEYAPGITLDALLLRRGRLPWPPIARVVGEVAGALAYTHGRRDEDGRLLRIMHGRIAPRRITISASGRAKLTGLGTSWAWPDHQGWGSPEETRQEPIDGRADVFALGLILRGSVDGPLTPELARIVEQATHPFPEHRCTAQALHESLERVSRRGATRSRGPALQPTAQPR
jgi:serine/threonine protein kinase